RQLINRATLAKMKPSAFFINTARGALVNEPDLVEAIRNQRIAGAAIDVFEEEPPGDHALFQLENVVVTPHAAGVDVRSRDDMANWDAGQHPAILSPAALAGKNEWNAITAGKNGDSFQGDAVLSNGRIVVVVSKRDGSVAVHGIQPDSIVTRTTLRLTSAAGE